MNTWIVFDWEAREMTATELVNAFDRACDGEVDCREAKEVLRRELLRRLQLVPH